MKDKPTARAVGWTLAALTGFVSCYMVIEEPALIRMVVIVFLQLLSMKVLVATETYTHRNGLTILQWVCFAAGWFGMRPQPFESLLHKPLPGAGLVIKAVSRIAAGFCLLYLSRQLEHTFLTKFFLPQLCLLAGISFILHFGLLTLSVAWWRILGVDVQELFRAPYRSTSLKEFWGRRWNLAFSEMTALIVYRPLKTHISTPHALTAAFLLSGILHEVAISLPVMFGFGLPTTYFVIQAAAMQMEASSPLIRNLMGHPLRARLWVMAVLILPIPLLFHSRFVSEVLIPLRNMLLPFAGI